MSAMASGDDGAPDGGDGWNDDAELEFWRRLARAGANAVSEGLSEPDFARLHLSTPLEDQLLAHLRKKRSLVLAANAGDGKTHLAHALKRRLEADAERIVFEFDATASMASGSVAPLVETWRQAIHDWRVGWRLTSAVPANPGFEVSLDATRSKPANDDAPPEHELMLRSVVRW